MKNKYGYEPGKFPNVEKLAETLATQKNAERFLSLIEPGANENSNAVQELQVTVG